MSQHIDHARFARWLGLATASLALPAFAQAPPNAGTVLQEVRPPAAVVPKQDAPVLPMPPETRPRLAASPDARLTLRQVRIAGATVFSEAQLLPLVQDAVGKDTDLAGLEALAGRISRHYRQAGYTVATAYLPQQNIRDGVVEIAVIEGRYGAITVRGAAAPAVSRQLGALAVGDVVADRPLEQTLLLLTDMPGIAVKSTLQPGASVGTSELVIDAEPGPFMTGSAEADSFGSRATGKYRAGGTLSINSPAGRGDLVTLRAITSGEGLHYGRAAWQLPVGTLGSRIGVAASDMRYRLGKEFDSLDAKGSARILSVFAAHPLVRSRSFNLNLQANFDGKKLQDRVDSVAVVTDKKVQVLNLGISGDRRDDWAAGGVSVFSVTYSRGRLGIESPAAAAIDAATARSAGSYGKLAVNAVRVQALNEATSLYLSYSGQWASKNLDSSEKMSMGGAGAVRAYPQGEAPADRGHLLTVEVRRSLAPGWQLVGFVDAAHATINQERWAAATGPATRSLSGAGLGLNWAGASGWAARVFYAHKLGNAAATAEADRGGRLWAQLSKSF